MDRPLKKTETIEIRVPYETKLAFMARCREDGVSASETLRGFIGSRLETAPSREPAKGRRPWQLAGGLAVALGVAASAVPSLAGSVDRIGFDQLDADRSGAVTLSELSRGAKVRVRLEVGATGLELGRAAITPAASSAQGDALLRASFAAMDADGDGSVSFKEFRSR